MESSAGAESNGESPFDVAELRRALVLVMQHAGKELKDSDADVLVETLISGRYKAEVGSPRGSSPATEPASITSGEVGYPVGEDAASRSPTEEEQRYYEGEGRGDSRVLTGSLDPSWLDRHPRAAKVLEEHPEMYSLMVDMVERQEELMFAAEQAEATRKKKERDYLEHVEYLENMSVAEIEKARQQERANRQATVLRHFHSELTVEDIFDRLVRDLAKKEEEMQHLRQEQSKLKGEIAEMDYQQAQRHQQYSEEQRRLTEEMSKMRAQLREAQERSLRRRGNRGTTSTSSARNSLLIEHLQGLADEKTTEAEHLRSELLRLQQQRDEEDLDRAETQHPFPSSASNSLTGSFITSRSPQCSTPIMMVMSTSDDCTSADVLDDGNVVDRLTSLRRAKVAVLEKSSSRPPSLADDLATASKMNPKEHNSEGQSTMEKQQTSSLSRQISNFKQDHRDFSDSGDRHTSVGPASSANHELRTKSVQARKSYQSHKNSFSGPVERDQMAEGQSGGAVTSGGVVLRVKSGIATEKLHNRRSAPASVEWHAVVGEASVKNTYRPPSVTNTLSVSPKPTSTSAETENEKAASELLRSRIFNVAVLGDSGVGKTTFIRKFGSADDVPVPQSTIGVDFVVKSAVVDKQEVTLKMWDTAGSERFHCIAKNYLRRCDGVILMFDITNRNTFESLSQWRDDVMEICQEHAALLMIGNKMDLVENGQEQQAISMDEAMLMAHTINSAMYLEVSGQLGQGVSEACTILTRAMLAKEDQAILYSSQLRLFGLEDDDDIIKTGPCCCK